LLMKIARNYCNFLGLSSLVSIHINFTHLL
jgi:hypothetical protein